MFIFFGWGRQTIKNFGPVFENQCTNCNSKKYWNLVRSTTWFTLFFIPVIPYEVKYYLLCPACEHGIQLDRQKYYELKIIAENNKALINGQITQAQYISNVSSVSAGSSATNNTVASNNGVCGNCGKQHAAGIKFCKNCGAKL